MKVAVLFALTDSVYGDLDCDVWAAARDATRYAGSARVVAHPPCRTWGRLSHFAKAPAWEPQLAIFAIAAVRRCGGVLEHPAGSRLWTAVGAPPPGEAADQYGGWTLPVDQFWWGHRARKRTWLYIVGKAPDELPRMPLVLGDPPRVINTRGRIDQPRSRPWRREVTRRERSATPRAFAEWLLEVAA